ncbi:uncharacterized protein LOC113232382 [Hyposmocoma kahamanoa]|uniref:uncharacterized protein LOC113232382 n=1 Tax=Hyposmocoma kahamanoa TaxID=1477025 RepID=UPI000E6D648D|nr:uncharacterized protein LOC113232382 [Hyposmocoma kahamanoa]XP_026322862.1 uncharacterized protein LOC113232382 [Hyposmocoma kahamanoa]XP_026322864.1 uncharacterized protein LOC113232382 [Hyposmocoma kahamanoa]XP_026322865.1 uncharacterized protein LOC113232382 [Hyposmocoma kahamanoa]
MKLNLFKRSMIFATFFGSCLCIALIVASLGTTQWIEARAKRTSNPLESEGRISFGLFEGHKELNVGYGWRNRNFSVKAGTHPARRWAWCGCAGQLGAALAAAGGAAILAALASAARARASPRPLLISNSLAVLFTLGAISVWLTEYFLRLQYNVMSDEDLANTWTSDGMADLGLSFWLVVAASISALANIICVMVAMADGRDEDTIAPALEEKVNGAIMLY